MILCSLLTVSSQGCLNFVECGHSEAPRRCPYFDVVVGLAWSGDPESYTGGSLLLVGSPMPDGSKVMTQTKRDTLALQVGGR